MAELFQFVAETSARSLPLSDFMVDSRSVRAGVLGFTKRWTACELRFSLGIVGGGLEANVSLVLTVKEVGLSKFWRNPRFPGMLETAGLS